MMKKIILIIPITFMIQFSHIAVFANQTETQELQREQDEYDIEHIPDEDTTPIFEQSDEFKDEADVQPFPELEE